MAPASNHDGYGVRGGHRYTVLDSWRGICALIVTVMHFDALHHGWGLPFLRNGYLFVDFFFVLSGFVISHAYANRLTSGAEAARFMVRRFGRVWPLHAALLLAYIAVETGKWVMTSGLGVSAGLGAFEQGGRADLSTLASQVLLIQGMGLHGGLTWNLPSWSISVEFWTYLVFAIVSVAAFMWRSAVLLAVSAVCLAALMAWSPDAMFATYDLGFPRAVIGFTFGYLTWSLVNASGLSGAASSKALVPAWMGYAEWGVIAAIVLFVSVAGVGPLSFAAPLVFAAAVYVFSFEAGTLSRLLTSKPMQNLGLWSYAIYMVHDLIIYVLGLMVSVLQKVFGVTLWQDVTSNGETLRVVDFSNKFVLDLALIGYLGLVLVTAAMAYRWIEDPARRAFNRMSDRLISPGVVVGR